MASRIGYTSTSTSTTALLLLLLLLLNVAVRSSSAHVGELEERELHDPPLHPRDPKTILISGSVRGPL
jgi:hypothetical protein